MKGGKRTREMGGKRGNKGALQWNIRKKGKGRDFKRTEEGERNNKSFENSKGYRRQENINLKNFIETRLINMNVQCSHPSSFKNNLLWFCFNHSLAARRR